MSWTTELAAAESVEASYRATRKGALNNFYRFDGRGAQLLSDWIRARAAVSSAGVPASDQSYWGNVAARAVSAMGPSWAVVQGQPLAALFEPSSGEMHEHNPFGFPALDGLFGGLVSAWASAVWLASGRTHGADFPRQEVWSYIFANALTIAGAT